MDKNTINTGNDAFDIVIDAMNSEDIMSKFSLVFSCEIDDKKYVILNDLQEDIDAVFELQEVDDYNDFILVEDDVIIDAVCNMYYDEIEDTEE